MAPNFSGNVVLEIRFPLIEAIDFVFVKQELTRMSNYSAFSDIIPNLFSISLIIQQTTCFIIIQLWFRIVSMI